MRDWGVLESRKCGQAGLTASHFPLAAEAKTLPRRRELDVVDCAVYAVAVYAGTPQCELHTRAILISTWQNVLLTKEVCSNCNPKW